MALTAYPYGAFLRNLAAGQHNVLSDTVNVLLTTSGYTPNVDTHANLSDLSSEVTGTGYTAGGKTLANKSLTYDATNKWALFGADPVVWSGATFTARYAVVYKATGTASTSLLIGYIDLGADTSYASEDAQLSFTNGVVRIKSI